MTILPLLAVGFFIKIVAAIWFFSAAVLIVTILIQKGKGGGLSGALGGMGGAGSILGTKTGDFLTWVTIVLVGIFLLFAVILNKFYKPSVSDFGQQPAPQQQTQPQIPAKQPIPGIPGWDVDADTNTVE